MTEPRTQAPIPTLRDLRNFGFVFGGVAAIVAILLWWRGRLPPAQGFAIASLAFFAVGLLVPQILKPFFGPWMKFAEILGFINTRILLGLFFIVGVTPTGLLMRLAGKDPMGRTFKRKSEASYWTKSTAHANGSKHFENQF